MKLSEWLNPEEFKKAKELVQKGEDLMDADPKLFDRLYEYYAFEVHEMPYGTMKARDGDPAKWIAERLEREFRSQASTTFVWRKGTEGWSCPFKQKVERGRKYDDITGYVWEEDGKWHWQFGGAAPDSILQHTMGKGSDKGVETSLEMAQKACEKAWLKNS
jgi:hypothetical protein